MIPPLRRVLSLSVLVTGCGPTGTSTGPPPGEGPVGWIYATAGGGNLTVRVDAATGRREEVTWPNPPLDENTLLWEGNISPIDGDVMEQGETGRLWDRTFHLDAATGVARDLGAPEVTSETDFRWSPDGRAVVFLRHLVQFDTRNRLVWIDPVTGQTDTLLTPDQAGGILEHPFWIAADTVGVTVEDRTPPLGPSRYAQIALATWAVRDYEEIPWAPWHVPLISADGAWMAHWVVHDSVTAEGESAEYATLRVRHRITGQEHAIWGFPALTTYEASISIAISPDSRFLATCPTNTDVAIVRLSTGQEVKRVFVPYCETLNWSWGPEGPPS